MIKIFVGGGGGGHLLSEGFLRLRFRGLVPLRGCVIIEIVRNVVMKFLKTRGNQTSRSCLFFTGHLVNLKAHTIIQYFANADDSTEVEKSAGNNDKAMKYLSKASNATSKTYESSETEILPNVGLKPSPQDKRKELLESKQAEKKTIRNESPFSSSKDLQFPKRTKGVTDRKNGKFQN